MVWSVNFLRLLLRILVSNQFISRKVIEICTIFLDLRPFHTESDASSGATMRLTEKIESKGPFTHRASELCSNATNGKIRTLYILMMYSHCRVITRAKSIATVIARIGHVSNLTTHIKI